jgi:hypothetical protein
LFTQNLYSYLEVRIAFINTYSSPVVFKFHLGDLVYSHRLLATIKYQTTLCIWECSILRHPYQHTHTTHALSPKGKQRLPRHSSETPTLYQNHADVTGIKPIAVRSQSISGVNAMNPLAAYYDIHGRKRDAILLFFSGYHTRRALWIEACKENVPYLTMRAQCGLVGVNPCDNTHT